MSAMRSASSSTSTSTSPRRQLAPLHEVDEATGRADHDVDAALQRADLAVHRRRRRRPRRRCGPRTLAERLEHVVTWLASSRVGTSTSAVGCFGLGLADALEQRDAEGERLARAGLGLAADVAAGERVGGW